MLLELRNKCNFIVSALNQEQTIWTSILRQQKCHCQRQDLRRWSMCEIYFLRNVYLNHVANRDIAVREDFSGLWNELLPVVNRKLQVPKSFYKVETDYRHQWRCGNKPFQKVNWILGPIFYGRASEILGKAPCIYRSVHHRQQLKSESVEV